LWLAASSGEEVADATEKRTRHIKDGEESQDGEDLPADVQRSAEDVVQGVSHD
jgi:hypothetical protein